jgi:serine/threonine protein kinase
MAGQILGQRYQVERQIGKQTGRWTLLAKDLDTQEFVVLKLIFIDEQLEWDDLKLFEREVEILKSISHPSIPRYLGYFEHDLPNAKAMVLIQNYVEGKSLEQCLQQGRIFTEPEAKQLGKALLGILQYLHGLQPPIIHRDIKPSNVLLANRQLYLVDFGSVKRFSGGDSTAFTVVGTYGYMPPEQFSGRAVPASDLYSLAATLVALITGTHPSSLPHRGAKIDLSQVPNLSTEFADWLGWLLEANVPQRAKTVQEALYALEHGHRPTSALEKETATNRSSVTKPADTKVVLTKDTDVLELQIPSRLGQVELVIDRQTISLSTKRLGVAAGRQQAPRHQIQKLHYRQPDPTSPTSDPDAGVTIWAGSEKFILGNNPPLSPAELEWIAQELSAWLKLAVNA